MPSTGSSVGRPDRAARLLLGLAAVAVMFAAADTYVVVLSLPDMMGSVGLSIEELQRAAPIVSGFLLGYVAMLPLIGRIADLRGRTPVLVGALVVFAFGSLITAAAYDLGSLVTGRFLQGVGGGGLVPVTLALVADLYPADRRGVPLGVVGAVQELGSVLGPLYGAVVLAFGTWRDIFWINLAVGLVLAAAIRTLRPPKPDSPERSDPSARRVEGPNTRDYPSRRVDWIGLLLLALTLVALLLVMRQPRSLVTSVELGGPFVPFGSSDSIWWSPIGLVAIGLAVAFVVWLLVAKRPLVDLRDWWSSAREADLVGAGLLSVALGGIILAFATADPEVQVFSKAGPWYLAVAAVAAVLFGLHNRRSKAPLVPHGAFAQRPAWGALVVSFFVGAALIAALVDIPIFARITVADGSQIKAALVLVEFLVALPVGALLGGVLTRRAAGRVHRRGRDDPGRLRLLADGRLGLRVAAPPDVLGRAGDDRARLRPRARARQRRAAGEHQRRGPRRHQCAARGGPDGGDAGRDLGADHDRAAALLRRGVRVPLTHRGVRRRQDPVRGVHPPHRAGRHRAAARDLPRSRGVRRRRRGRGRALLPRRRDARHHDGRDDARRRLMLYSSS